MSTPGAEFVEVFLQEASEHLQFLREYSGILQDPYPVPEDIHRLYIASHTLEGSSGSYGFPLFREVASKLSHIFQYAMNATIAPDATAALVEFISEGVAVLESDLLMISANAAENAEEIAAFKQRYAFAFETANVAPSPAQEYVAPVNLHSKPELPLAAEQQAQADARPQTETKAPADPKSQPRQRTAGAEVSPETEQADALADVPDLEPDGEVPAEILEFFVPEAEEHLQIVQDCLLALETSADPDAVHRLFRAMHTIKGSAAQVGLQRISHVAHRAEDLVGRVRDGEIKPTQHVIDLCFEAVDAIKKFAYNQWPDEPTLQKSVKSLLQRLTALIPVQNEKAQASEPTPTQPTASPTTADSKPRVSEPATAARPALEDSSDADQEPEFIAGLRSKEPTALPQSKSVRIALERLDSMMNAVGELVINRTRMLGRLSELERLAEVLTFSKGRMSEKIGEFQEKYEFSRLTGTFSSSYSSAGGYALSGGFGDPSEFSELEMDRYDDYNILSRSLTEISADVTEVLTQLDGFVRRVDSDIDEFTELAHRLQDEITQARMVPIGNLYTRISRTVRDAAKAAGKQVELSLSGAETELDNSIIQQISDPLIHLVRNAVAHGLESSEERYNSGKTDHGNVAVRAYHRGNHIYIEVEDDGRGIDYERVRNTAIGQGLYSAEQAERLSEREWLELLFHPGFSTAERKTELAGRGVGLDVVRANLTTLNGEIDVDTQKSVGTRFTLKVPLTLIISQALFVRCGDMSFAFPLSFVEEIRRVPASTIEEVGGKLLTKVRDAVTEVVRLDSQLGLPPGEPINGFYHLVIVSVAGRSVGVIVDEVIRKDEIVIKNLGEYLRNAKLFPGATIAPDGSLILLIDINRLVAGESIERRPLMTNATAARIFAPGAAAVAAGEIPESAIEHLRKEKLVILADDSISVRKFVGRMLEKAGYRVRLAGDGLEALEIALQTPCDLIITDLEMPRTNGYELMMHLRQNPETKNIPVMVVTSRAGAKHRERAIKEGASAFLTKPVQDEQLIAAVAGLIGSASGVPVEAHAASRVF
ncbi:MAG TPA: response regulator [Terriglobales bacterium]|nr:response regulator [Terriglobales bacterium]